MSKQKPDEAEASEGARRCACGNHFRVRMPGQREDKCPGCCLREEEVAAALTKRRGIDDIEAIQ
jgi:hypothetical protein